MTEKELIVQAMTEQEGTAKEIMEQMQPYAYWLDTVFGVGEKTAALLLNVWQNPKAIFEAEDKELACYLNAAQQQTIRKAKENADVEEAYLKMTKGGICFIPSYHPAYPKRLLTIPDRPFGIYVYGNIPAEDRPAVAIVGARQCSEYGRFIAAEFGGALAANGIQVISGLARGIDGISQQAAVEAGGDTYAVLGCGVDICYPASHKVLYEQISRKGGILSTYQPGTIPKPSLFPPRNRIISGLADIVLVVEARHKSGTLITVDMALEQGREVFVVPGRLTDRLSDGCNRLIKQGAGVVLSPESFIQEIGEITGCHRKMVIPTPKEQATCDLNDKERKMLSLLDFTPKSMEEIRGLMAEKPSFKEVSLQESMHILLSLVMREKVFQPSAGYFAIKAGER